MMDSASKNLAAVVNTSQGSYRVLVGSQIIDQLGVEMERAGLSGRVFMVADQAMYRCGMRAVQESLEKSGFETHVFNLPSGETIKNLKTLKYLYTWLAELHGERDDTVVALGGGVTGDIAGFAAATWLRGVPLVQVPTTLAAMVDACLGGKVAANLPEGKNLVGAFHQPRLVISNLNFLKTLPRRELLSGWAEAIKHGLILDSELLALIEGNVETLLDLDDPLTAHVIRRSVAIKADVISADEYETGDRRVLLNYGHTIGHAIEAVTGFGEFLHGEAVSVGMMGAASIAEKLGLVGPELVGRQRALLECFDLPLCAPGLTADSVVDAMRSDKKTRGGSVRWVLLDALGSATIRQDVPSDVVVEAVMELVTSD